MPLLDDREWRGKPGAADSEIAELVATAAIPLPASYLALLREFDGGEGPLPIQALWFQLDPVAVVIWNARDGTFKRFFTGLFVIGSNGGGEGIAFDLRDGAAKSLVYFDMTNCDLAESIVHLADDFDTLLDMIGLEQQ